MSFDMTQGKPAPLLVRFALPLILSAIVQQLYTLCDSVIVGRLLGEEAFAAVGAAAFLHGIPLNILLGGTQGFGVALGQRFGAKDEAGLTRFFSAAGVLSLVLGGMLSLLGLLFLNPLLTLMKTPAQLMALSAGYLKVLWLGLPVTALMNLAASGLRAVGDSRTPLRGLLLSSVLNILLDVLLVAVFPLGVMGTALATVLSQLAAGLLFLTALRKAGVLTCLGRPGGDETRELLRLGVPPMLSFGVNAASGGLYQRAINGFGVAVITGMSASYRYFDLFNVVGYGMEGAVSVFSAQNAGAKNYHRIRQGTRWALVLGGGATLVINLLAILFAEPLIQLFIGGETVQAVQVGAASLRVRSAFVASMYLLCAWRAAIGGMGNAMIPMISGFMELGLKTTAVLILPGLLGLPGLYLMDAAAWIPTALFLGICYRAVLQRRCKTTVSRGINDGIGGNEGNGT